MAANDSGQLPRKNVYDFVELLASTTATATSTGTTPVLMARPTGGVAFTLDVTVDESTVADKLDVFVQTLIDGASWVDVCHFPQHDGNAGAARYIEKNATGLQQAGFEIGDALAEGNTRNLHGDSWRVRYAIIDDSGSASFTFSVQMCPM